MIDIPNPLMTPTLPLTCSKYFCASSFFCMSTTAFCAWLTAAVAVDRNPPHHDDPPPPPGCDCGTGVACSGSGDSSAVVVAGVYAGCVDRALSPDLRVAAALPAALSSLARPGGGVAVEVRTGDRLAPVVVLGLSEGVPGRLEGLARSPRSLSRSFSVCEDLAAPAPGRALEEGFVAGRAVAGVGRSSNCASSSSLVGPAFLDMFGGAGTLYEGFECRSGGCG